MHSVSLCHSKGCAFSLTHRWIGCTASIKASLLGLRVIWAQTTKANATVCLYCKWLLKNWHSHLANTSHLSQTNEGLVLQSEIDISLWTSTRIFWILREVHSSHGTAEAPLSSLVPPKRGKKIAPVDLPCSSTFTHSSWAMAAEIWPSVSE